MPTMPRFDLKSQKIAYAIMGTPPNMRKRSKRDKDVDRRLLYEETSRVR